MRKQKRHVYGRSLYFLLVCILIFTIAPISAWAASADQSSALKNKASKNKTTVTKTVTIETAGQIIKKKVKCGSTVILPTEINGNGYTFLGWSTVRGQTCDPMYQAYEKLHVTKNIHLYPVKYKWSQEPDIYVGGLADSVDKYDKIIFVGDSRTAMLRSTLQRQCGSDILKKMSFVCQTGQGLDWMKKWGEKQLFDEISKTDDNEKKTAVIFNLGVNDLIHKNGKGVSYDSVASDYASYMNGLSRKLTTRNCELFYMSVNPCNTAMKPTRKESEIRGFNNRLRQRLNGNFKWINSYSYLMRHGYTTRCEFRGYTDDGVHYSMRTFKRIYSYAIKKIR